LENVSVWQIPVFRYGLLMRNLGYIEFETVEKQWSYLRNIKTAINYFFLQMFSTKSTHISHRKNEAELWDLPNTWTFYSKDVASAMLRLDIFPIPFSLVWTCSSGIQYMLQSAQ
jgi:hypothetical protein